VNKIKDPLTHMSDRLVKKGTLCLRVFGNAIQRALIRLLGVSPWHSAIRVYWRGVARNLIRPSRAGIAAADEAGGKGLSFVIPCDRTGLLGRNRKLSLTSSVDVEHHWGVVLLEYARLEHLSTR
jgi:hypothetical protein